MRAAIRDLNSAREVTGYIVQLPLPAGHDENAMLELIDPDKDADGLHPTNLGRLVLGIEGELHSPLPCTPAGIVEMLRRYDVPIRGQHVTVIGRGLTVGRPLGLLFTRKGLDATVTLTHSRTVDLAAEVRRADIVVAAVGVPHLVKPEWIKPGAAVLDVGITRVQDEETGKGRLTGDVDPARRRGRRPPLAEPRRRRPDDPRDAARERREGGRAAPAPVGAIDTSGCRGPGACGIRFVVHRRAVVRRHRPST